MKRAEPGQVRVHRGYMRAGGDWELWPVAAELRSRNLQRIENELDTLLLATIQFATNHRPEQLK